MFKLTTSIVRSTFSAFKPMRLLSTPRFYFANVGRQVATPPPKDPPKISLKEQVENEIKYEKENTPENTELLDQLKKDNWELTSKGLFHELTRRVGDKVVNITFLSRSPAPTNESNQGENPQQEEQQPDNVNDFFEFTVYIRKGNSPQALYSDFIVADGEVTMGSLSFTGDYDTHKTQGKMERPQNIYQGPDLETLDENLVQNLTTYFEGLGVNEELISFIEQYSLNSEHEFYVKWLEQLKEYV